MSNIIMDFMVTNNNDQHNHLWYAEYNSDRFGQIKCQGDTFNELEQNCIDASMLLFESRPYITYQVVLQF